MKLKMSWREKLNNDKGLPKVIEIDGKLSKRWSEGTCVVPAPREVDEIMKRIPKGRVITINEIRHILAEKRGATIGCPITTGIFAWIVANAAEEAYTDGKKRITPYWRTLKSDGSLNEKYPGGVQLQKSRLEDEGYIITKKGKKYRVLNWKELLI